MTKLDINSMNDNYLLFAYSLDIVKENSRSIYAKGMYDNEYRIEKKSKNVFLDGVKVADTCTYYIY